MYPIAEIFTSVQGEGTWAGTRMTFVRLAGCTVGKPYPKTSLTAAFKMLQPYQEKCTLWDGREFPCDTDFKKKMSMSESQIVAEVGDEIRVCLTGGEPLMHNVVPLCKALHQAGKVIHLETSGTIELGEVRSQVDWIAISPKKGLLTSALMSADEVKVLVDGSFDTQRFERDILAFVRAEKVWFQPVNKLHEVDGENLRKCQEIQSCYKNVRISVQMHKWMGVR